jgi:hypothetical protein
MAIRSASGSALTSRSRCRKAASPSTVCATRNAASFSACSFVTYTSWWSSAQSIPTYTGMLAPLFR